MKVKNLLEYLNEKYPFAIASSFDQGKMGLQVGSEDCEIMGVLITLDVTSDVIDEALAKRANVIISHHPFIFNPIIRIDYQDITGKRLLKVLNNHLNIINMHTNYDSSLGGMNDELAKILDLKEVQSYYSEQVDNNFLRYGFCQELTLKDLAQKVKEKFNQGAVRVVGNLDQKVKTIGIVGGSGTSEIDRAIEVCCDCLITGEVKQNLALSSKERGLAIIEVSHHIESLFKEPLKKQLEKAFKGINIYFSEKDVDPFVLI